MDRKKMVDDTMRGNGYTLYKPWYRAGDGWQSIWVIGPNTSYIAYLFDESVDDAEWILYRMVQQHRFSIPTGR